MMGGIVHKNDATGLQNPLYQEDSRPCPRVGIALWDFALDMAQSGRGDPMPMMYRNPAIPESLIPKAASPIFQHLLATYVSETNKTASVWREFGTEDMSFRPHPRSTSVQEQMRHQLLSERRFFCEFLGTREPDPSTIIPSEASPEAFIKNLTDLAMQRLEQLSPKDESWWLQPASFFDVQRERIWIFWRRLLHTAHHRAQLTVCLRLLNKSVPSVYGPTADATWVGADPTNTVDAARRA